MYGWLGRRVVEASGALYVLTYLNAYGATELRAAYPRTWTALMVGAVAAGGLALALRARQDRRRAKTW